MTLIDVLSIGNHLHHSCVTWMIPTLALIALMAGICELGLDWVGHQNMGESWGSMCMQACRVVQKLQHARVCILADPLLDATSLVA